MKTLKSIRNFDWSAAWPATKILGFVIGVQAVILIAVNLHTWMLAGAALAIIAMWALIFQIVRAATVRSNIPPATLRDVRARLYRASEKAKDAVVGDTLRACVAEIDEGLRA